jgi:NAD(P)-dependent dehydrogenase (short-subunit alcohol dehydrogenase family)
MLDGRTVVLTGAAGALGRATAEALAAAGANVVLVDLDGAGVRELERELDLPEGRSLALGGDLADPERAKEIAIEAAQRFGGVDALVLTAGGFAMGPRVEELDLSDLDAMMRLNVHTAVAMIGAAAPWLRRSSAGRVVLISSLAATEAPPLMSAYAIAKSALLRIVESASRELMDDGVTVNAVLPSVIDTPANREAMPQTDPGTWVEPGRLGRVLAFLISDDAADITGAAIPVRGRVT